MMQHRTFYAQYSLDGEEFQPAQGFDFSLNGMSILSVEPIAADHRFFVRLSFTGADLTLSAEKASAHDFAVGTEMWSMTAVRFIGGDTAQCLQAH
jgi:hypothetical protein